MDRARFSQAPSSSTRAFSQSSSPDFCNTLSWVSAAAKLTSIAPRARFSCSLGRKRPVEVACLIAALTLFSFALDSTSLVLAAFEQAAFADISVKYVFRCVIANCESNLPLADTVKVIDKQIKLKKVANTIKYIYKMAWTLSCFEPFSS